MPKNEEDGHQRLLLLHERSNSLTGGGAHVRNFLSEVIPKRGSIRPEYPGARQAYRPTGAFQAMPRGRLMRAHLPSGNQRWWDSLTKSVGRSVRTDRLAAEPIHTGLARTSGSWANAVCRQTDVGVKDLLKAGYPADKGTKKGVDGRNTTHLRYSYLDAHLYIQPKRPI